MNDAAGEGDMLSLIQMDELLKEQHTLKDLAHVRVDKPATITPISDRTSSKQQDDDDETAGLTKDEIEDLTTSALRQHYKHMQAVLAKQEMQVPQFLLPKHERQPGQENDIDLSKAPKVDINRAVDRTPTSSGLQKWGAHGAPILDCKCSFVPNVGGMVFDGFLSMTWYCVVYSPAFCLSTHW